KLGIVTGGKSYLDVRQALGDLGIGEAEANRLGIRLFKVACPWPLDLEHIADFARGLETIVVVEEKRSLIETQLREHLYATAMRPPMAGRKEDRGAELSQAAGASDPNDAANALGERIPTFIGRSNEVADRVARLRKYKAMLADTRAVAGRPPISARA